MLRSSTLVKPKFTFCISNALYLCMYIISFLISTFPHIKLVFQMNVLSQSRDFNCQAFFKETVIQHANKPIEPLASP